MFYNMFCSIVSCSVIEVLIENPLAPAVLSPFTYLITSISCPHSLLCISLMRSRSLIRWWLLWFLISGIIFVALLCTFSVLSMSQLKCEDQNYTAHSRCGWSTDLYSGRISSLFLYLKLWPIDPVFCWLFRNFSLFVFAT